MALVRIQLRRDTAANWTAANPVLANGEPGLETDTGKVKYGNGVQNWAALPYATNTPLANSAPPTIGSATTGTSASAARADHTHAFPAVLSVDSLATSGDVVVGGNATVTGTLTAAKLSTSANNIVDLTETVQDIVGDAVKAGDGIKVAYDDNAGTITVSSSAVGSGTNNSITLEDVDDRVAGLLTAGAGISLQYNDGLGTLTVSAVSLDGGDVPGDLPTPSQLAISTNPATIEVEEDGLAVFAVAATGNRGTVTYQWEYLTPGGAVWQNVTNGSGTAGATTARLTIDGVTASLNKRWFRCAVTDDQKTVRSRAGQLQVNYFEITVQPVSTTAVNGSTTPATTFSVTAVSDDAITYQWQTLASGVWTNISGATSATYGSISATANAAYRCAVTSNSVTLYSNSVTLSVTDAPVTITTQPSDATASSGAATFTAAYSGGSSPTVRWQVQRAGFSTWEDISGATTTTLSLTGLVGVDNGNKYRMVVTSGTSSLATNDATLTVAGPAITIQPQDATASLGAATFSFAYSGGTGSVQWWSRPVGSVSWTAVSGQTATTLSLTGLLVTNSGTEYSATVTISGIAVRTRAALLTVSADVYALEQPQSVVVQDGQEFTMRFRTTYGAGERYWFFQWQARQPGNPVWQSLPNSDTPFRAVSATDINGVALSTFIIYPGNSLPELRLRASVAMSGTQYRARMWKGGSPSEVPARDEQFSETATLTVTQAPSISLPSVLPVDRPASMTQPYRLCAERKSTVISTYWRSHLAQFAYGGGRIVGVGHGGDSKATVSPVRASSGGVFPVGLPLAAGSNNSHFAQLNRGTNRFIYSDDDGATWSSGQFPVSAIWTDVAFGGGRFVAVGVEPSVTDTCKTYLCMSADGGRTWQSRALSDGIAWMPRIIGSPSSGFLVSANGDVFHCDSWNAVVASDLGIGLQDGVNLGGAWIAVGPSEPSGITVVRETYSGNPPFPLLQTIVFENATGVDVNYRALPWRALGGVRFSEDNGVNWRQYSSTIDYIDPGEGISQSCIASAGSVAVLISSSGTHVHSTSDGVAFSYSPVYLSAVNSGGSVNTIEVRAVAAVGQDILYLAKNAYRATSTSQEVRYVLAYRAPASTPHLATPVYTEQLTGDDSADGYTHVIATDRYFVAIDPVGGGVLRFPLAVGDHVSEGDPTDGRPGAPRSTQATPLSPTSISISWTAPPSGGAPITGYVLQRSTDMGRTWAQVSTPSSSSVSSTATGLTQGTTYMFRVAAVNSIGTGPYSFASNVTAPTTIRTSAPRNVSAVVTTHSASNARKPTFLVTWQVPEVDGGSPVTGYEIQARRQVINADGSRQEFQEWRAFPPRGTSGHLHWSEITGTSAVTADRQERSGARYGVQHRVAASNANGIGPWAESNVVDWGSASGTAPPAPGPGTVAAPGTASALTTTAIANPIGDAGNPGFTLSWTAPAAGTGGTPTGYVVQTRKQIVGASRGAFDAWETLGVRNTTSPSDPAYRKWATVSGTTATVALSGMRSGTTYGFQFRVAATNSGGQGPYVEGSTVDWPSASSAPTAPTSVSATRINNTITGNATQPGFTVSWTAPSSAGSSSISSYVVQWRYRPLDSFGNAGEYGPWQALPARNTTDTSSPAYRTWATVSGTSATVSGGGFRSTLKYEFQFRIAALNSTGASPYGESSAIQWPAP